jgi:hypothetical protein
MIRQRLREFETKHYFADMLTMRPNGFGNRFKLSGLFVYVSLSRSFSEASLSLALALSKSLSRARLTIRIVAMATWCSNTPLMSVRVILVFVSIYGLFVHA